MKRLAVVLFNLGGPDSAAAIKPFLYNLFRDPAIIDLPFGLRQSVAWLISTRRTKVARAIYAHMGGRSPILPQTQAQADALEAHLAAKIDGTVKCFIAMRYWHPFAEETALAVQQWGATEILLLPLYPQFSYSTTASSIKNWQESAAKINLSLPCRAVESYPLSPGMIAAQVELLHQAMLRLGQTAFRVLFSAHGLPVRMIEKGDPYANQVALTAKAIAEAAGLTETQWLVSFQSRVGPVQWLEPSTDREIERAGAEGLGLIVLPLSFVSEHSETLVELDIEYRHLAESYGVPVYERVPALATHPLFIQALGDLVTAV